MRVRPTRARVDPTGRGPTFTVTTDRRLYRLEVAVDPILFNGSLAARRGAGNFYSSASEGPAFVRGGRATYRLEEEGWRRLRRFPYLYYRAVVFDGSVDAPQRMQFSTTDADYRRAPSIYIAPAGTRPPPARSRLSGTLTWLRVTGNRVVDEAGDTVVLRGINRSGMEYTDRNDLDPTGVRRPTSREAAGITMDDIREMTRVWRANVVRVPMNQEWALTRADYLTNLDSIIRWAAAEGAYTLLSLHWFDKHREFGRFGTGQANRLPPMPEESSLRLWRLLASRYRREPAVLYDVFSAPHVPLPSDTSFLFERPADEAGWLHMWHSWLRRIEPVIHRENERALIFASGWDWASNLRHFPVPLTAGRTLTNAVYSAHIYSSNAPGGTSDFDHLFGFTRLRSAHPVFLGEWGGTDGMLDWGDDLETYMRGRHRYTNGVWQGLAGWAAWSWADAPLLVQRGQGTRVEGAATLRWRTYLRDAMGRNRPTGFGELVRGALHVMPFAESSDFALTQPAGSRTPYRITAPAGTRRGDFFPVRGHDFTAGTRLRFTHSLGTTFIVPDAITPHLLIVAALPAGLPLGPANVEALRPDGVTSRPVSVTITSAALPTQTVLAAGAAKAAPYTIVMLANPVVEDNTGAFSADPIQGNRALFHRAVAGAIESLYGRTETFVLPYAQDIRIVAHFAPSPVVAANALCRQMAGATMEPMRNRIAAFLAGLGLAADVCLVVFSSATHNRDSAWSTTDENTSSGLAFTYDARNGNHRRAAATPGTVALSAPTDQLTPMHEFLHAASDLSNGRIRDLYNDGALAVFDVNRKRRAATGGTIPRSFATYNGARYASDRRRDGIGYPNTWRNYHSELIDVRRPNVMDNYFLADDATRCRLDRLTLRFIRDRIEWKLQR